MTTENLRNLRLETLRNLLVAALLCASLPVAAQISVPAAAEIGGAIPGPLPVFAADNWWNQDISGAPVDPASAQFIAFIGASRGLHPDFGGYDIDDPTHVSTYGFPYTVVDGSQPKQAVQFYFPDESDGVTHPGNQSVAFYPIPEEAKTQPHWIEGGAPGQEDPGGDRHMLIVDRDNRRLYELYDLHWDVGSQRWTAGSGAFFDLNRSDRRPEGWTSADAAGLAIFPGLVRYDEVYGPDEIRHAFRVTVQDSNGYVWPASHAAGRAAGALPLGARLRLKASVDLAGKPADVQKIFRAMQRYGLIVADNGADMYISGTFDTRWNNDVLNREFGRLHASDFEVVQLGWRGGSPPCAPPGPPQAVDAPVIGTRVSLSWQPPASGGVQGYAVEAGSHPGAADLGRVVLPPGQTSFAADVPAGTYYVRVRAGNACGTAASADLPVVVPSGCPAVGAPASLSAKVAGSLVTLGWSAAAGASSYVLEAGSAPGAANVLRAAVSGLGVTGAAPPGVYYVRVRGRNACGVGAASPEQMVSVGACVPPAPAGGITVTVTRGVVTLRWPAMAGASAYRLEVGLTPGAAQFAATIAGTAVTTPAPSGTYWVRVRGIGPCGPGAATPDATVHVP